MYDIEGKYKKLLQIADNKIPKRVCFDKQKRYLSECERYWDIKVILKCCHEDERVMLETYLLYQKEICENGKVLFELMNFIILCFNLMILTYTMMVSGDNMELSRKSLIIIDCSIGAICVVYILIYGIFTELFRSRLKKIIYILKIMNSLK